MRGSIRKREGKKGVTWQVTVELPKDPITGKRRQKKLTVAGKKEADALAAQYVTKLESGGFSEGDAKKLTLEAYLTRWLDATEGTIKPISRKRYGDLMRLHVIPSLGRVQLNKLSPIDLQRLYADRLTKGDLSTTTVSNIHGVLHRALKQAVRWGLVSRNVTEAVDAPRKINPTCVTWSKEQVSQFLRAADRDEFAALWRVALFTGMRRGEMLALRWDDVDLTRSVLAVRRTYSRSAAGGFEVGQPKTAAGRRSIALPRSLVEGLQRHRVRQLETRLRLAAVYQDQGLVFTNPTGGPLHPNSLAMRFKRIVAEAEVPYIRIHDLRHTSATLMLANGEHPKIVQERLGHSDVSMTLNRYSHVTMDMQRDAAARLDALMEEA